TRPGAHPGSPGSSHETVESAWTELTSSSPTPQWITSWYELRYLHNNLPGRRSIVTLPFAQSKKILHLEFVPANGLRAGTRDAITREGVHAFRVIARSHDRPGNLP